MQSWIFSIITLICRDWSDWSISFKAAFVSSVLLCVQQLPGKQLFLMLQKQHLVAKNEFAFSFRPTRKSCFSRSARNKWAGNMLMFHVDINMKRLGIRFKNNSFQWFRVDSFFWETITLYMVHFRFKTLQDVFIHLELCYTLHERSFSKIHNRGTLRFIANTFWSVPPFKIPAWLNMCTSHINHLWFFYAAFASFWCLKALIHIHCKCVEKSIENSLHVPL